MTDDYAGPYVSPPTLLVCLTCGCIVIREYKDAHTDWHGLADAILGVAGPHEHQWRGVVDGSSYCVDCGVERDD